MSQEIVKRATITETVAKRNEALAAYDEALAHFRAMQAAMKKAHTLRDELRGGSRMKPSYHIDRLPEFLTKYTYTAGGTDEAIKDGARRLVDADAWAGVLDVSGIETLMDATEKKKFRDQLCTDAPEYCEDTIRATVQRLAVDADAIFVRGLLNMFAKLDRSFKSHDGFKVGSRVVISYCFSDHGTWNHYSAAYDLLRDIERAMHLLDGKENPCEYAGIVGAIDAASAEVGGYGAKACKAESEYFRAQRFKNGNLHLWFTRDDLVRKVNKLIAEHHGAALGWS